MVRKFLVVATALLFGVPAAAIVTRHDVADRAYRAREAAWPAVFALYVNRAGHKDCVATLIAPQWAVTAAHCTHDRPLLDAMAASPARFKVTIAGRDAHIDRVIRHPASQRLPGGSFRDWVDLALIHLDRPVRGVRPIRLHETGDEERMIVSLPGWGTTGNGRIGLGRPDGLFRVARNRVGAAQGNWLFWRFDAPNEPNALPLEGVAGPGDSGGPALVRGRRGLEIIGVGSSQQGGERPEGTYGVLEGYVRVSQVAPWIRQQMDQGATR